MIPKNIISRKTRNEPRANPFLMSLTVLAAHTRCQVPWLNISAQAMAMKRVTAAVSPSVVQLDAFANSSLVIWFSGLEHATISKMKTRVNISPAWNLSVTMEAGRPARDV